jgi:hypothetical protein
MTIDEATTLPAGFEARVSEAGKTYYVDHNTKTTSWVHPRAHDGLPSPFERDFDEKGRAYYLDHNNHTTSWLNPVKLEELKSAGVMDIEVDELTRHGKTGNEWPWIVKETVESGTHKGEEYWVNYRRGPNGFVDNRSPEDAKAGYLAATPVREAREAREARERRGGGKL